MNQMLSFKHDLLQGVNYPTKWEVNNSLQVQYYSKVYNVEQVMYFISITLALLYVKVT